jgi:hypothetical protein
LNILNFIELIAALATALGVLFVALQIWQSKQQEQVAFEDVLTRQYRDIVQKISVRALLGDHLDDEHFESDLNEIYNYIDLTNEQIILRGQHRVSLTTWNNWLEGIKTNMSLPAFDKAWELIKDRMDGNFKELRRLEQSGYLDDPAGWQ